MSFTVPANFIDVFKIGDNINYNLKILRLLYVQYEQLEEGEKGYLIKPIVILNTSITEAILYDFIENRIRKAFRTEAMFLDVLSLLQKEKLDKFDHYINQAKKHDLLELKDTGFYEAMQNLRKKRNRIHIQNSKWEKPHDEIAVFDEKSKRLSEKVLEKILDAMATKYPRREEYHGYVEDFELPWEKHFV